MASSMLNKLVRWGGWLGLVSSWRSRPWDRRFWFASADNRGAILLETVVASMVFAMVGVAVLSGLSTTYDVGGRVEVQSEAENIARNQLESVFDQTFVSPPTPYPTYVGVPSGYTVTATTSDLTVPAPDIQRVNVTVSYGGASIVSVDTIRFKED